MHEQNNQVLEEINAQNRLSKRKSTTFKRKNTLITPTKPLNVPECNTLDPNLEIQNLDQTLLDIDVIYI